MSIEIVIGAILSAIGLIAIIYVIIKGLTETPELK